MTDLTRDGLDDERQFLLRSIADLDAERAAGDIEETDYVELRDGYTARAAAVLRAIDAGEGDPVPTAGAAAGRPPPRRRSTLVAIAGVLAFGAAAGLLLAHSAGTRLPGQTLSGDTQVSPAVKLDAQAQAAIGKGDILGAIKLFDKALTLAPANAQALAYKGWLIRLAGSQGNDPSLIDTGLTSVRKAETADPTYPDAHFFAGEILLRDKNDPRGAITEFEQFLADNPPQSMVPEVQGELQAAQNMLPPTTTTP